MRFFAVALLLVSGAQAQEIPSSWPRFQMSDFKGDKEMVAKIEKSVWWDNCVAWGIEARKKTKSRRMWALQENLSWNKTINGVDLGGVTGKVPEIGMTTCGALAVLGLPSTVNRTKGSYGEHVQYVWSGRRMYVYTRSPSGDANAIVDAVQY